LLEHSTIWTTGQRYISFSVQRHNYASYGLKCWKDETQIKKLFLIYLC